MAVPNATRREDVIQNAMNHEIHELEQSAPTPSALETIFTAELDHDLLTWPRQHLEPYLDLDEAGQVALSSEQLQDVLEAAFARDEALAVAFLEQVKAANKLQTFLNSSLQIVDARASGSGHICELQFDPGETTTRLVEHKGGSGVIHAHDKIADLDPRKLLGSEAPPKPLAFALNELAPGTRIEPALTESGTYRGTILTETTHVTLQRITRFCAVTHRKDDLDTLPRVGEHVRISYSDGLAHVEKIRERNRGRELAR